MKATELRIGNYYNYINGTKVARLSFEDFEIAVQCDLIPGYFDDLDPIPLTTEWLEKFGFENLGHGMEKSTAPDYIIRLILSQGDYYPQIDKLPELSSENMQSVPTNRIKHVHQLQNLYHALTGEELTIE